MNRFQSEEVKQRPQIISERQLSSTRNDHGNDDDDDIFTTNETNDDQQAHIRRRAPTRHSIKSLSGRKTLSKQASTEVKRIFFFLVLSAYFITLSIT
jgi:hypothetical protein